MLTASIPTAIVTTFYGLIIANMVFAPLARFVQRRADAEEEHRQSLIGWLTSELAREGVRTGRRLREQAAA
jgi:chemotaxis protein MotA